MHVLLTSFTTRALAVAAAAAALVLAVPIELVSQGQPAQNPPGQQAERQNQTATVTAGQIADNPQSFYGRKVTVRAEVEDVLSGNAFLLDEDRLFAWPDVLVIAGNTTAAVPEDEMVTVTGTVRPFVTADLRREYDWAWWDNLDPDLEVTFRNRPVIVADSIKVEDGNELVAPETR